MSGPTREPGSGPWRQAFVLFDEWLELPEARRPEWFAMLEARDPALAVEVARLIAADSAALSQSFLQPDQPPPGPLQFARAGLAVGPWTLERLLGAGGMGQVWLARRSDALYEGQAAIKLLRALADPGANERFAREGSLLARLQDPHIAQLLDAGVTPSGERYLVLEYVDGERIDQWCDACQLDLAARCRLFLDVCSAVAHAHRNLVVHRDLKPSNIFVDRRGQVKLLDFGVAKLLEGEGVAGDELTREAGAALTPQYASPEQLVGGPITTATDVFGLGMVLYGLLSGSRPWGGDRTPTLDPVRSQLPRPLWTLPVEPEVVAGQRGMSVEALRRSLRGDLSRVVAKAIRAEPPERYRSVEDFAADLRCVLEQRPVSARPASAGYRTRKFLRRNAAGVAIATVLAATLAAGVTGTLLQQRAALHEAQRSIAIKGFLLGLFESARTVAQGRGPASQSTVDDMLVAGARLAGDGFKGQPDTRDEVYQILVELVSDTGDADRTIGLARERVAAARAGFGADNPRTSPSEIMLAGVLMNFGQTDEAGKLLAHAGTVLDRAGDQTSIERARLWRWQGNLELLSKGRVPWQVHPLRRALDLLRARYPDDDELMAALSTAPTAACNSGDAAAALQAANELAVLAARRYGPSSLYALDARVSRAEIQLRTGAAAEAVQSLRGALQESGRLLGESHPNAVMHRLFLARALGVMGQQAESARYFAEARQLLDRFHAGDTRLGGAYEGIQAQVKRIAEGRLPHCGD